MFKGMDVGDKYCIKKAGQVTTFLIVTYTLSTLILGASTNWHAPTVSLIILLVSALIATPFALYRHPYSHNFCIKCRGSIWDECHDRAKSKQTGDYHGYKEANSRADDFCAYTDLLTIIGVIMVSTG